MDYWPSYIPKPSSLSESVDDPYIEATSETGDDSARVRYSKERQGPTKLTWKIMRLGDFVALKQFYADHRAIEFLWLHPSRGLTYKTRFVSSPISSSEDGKSPFVAQVEVTLQIVELAPTEQEQPSASDLMDTINTGVDKAVQAAIDAEQARDDAKDYAKKAAASAKEAADTAAEISAAVEAGIERIEEAGAAQVEAVNSAGTTQVSKVNSAGTKQTTAVNSAGTAQVSKVNSAGAAQVKAVEDAGSEQIAAVKSEGKAQTAAAKKQADAAAASAEEAADTAAEISAAVEAGIERIEEAGAAQVEAVNSAGTTQVSKVNSAGTKQTTAVNSAGTAQVSKVNSAGAAQVKAVEDAGSEQIAAVKSEGKAQTAAAKKQADAAAASAEEAAERLAEFKDLGAAAKTLAAGSKATASFDSSTGILTIGVPKGDKGDKGDPGTFLKDGVIVIANADGEAVAKDLAIGGDSSDLASDRGQIGNSKATNSHDFSSGMLSEKPGMYTATNSGSTNVPFKGPFAEMILGSSMNRGSLLITNGRPTLPRAAVSSFDNEQGFSGYNRLITEQQIGDGITVKNGIISVPEYEGATTSAAGTSGLVPPAAAGEENFVLHGDGTYRPVTPSLEVLNNFRKSMIGMSFPFPSTTLPEGFVWADGSLILFEDYPEVKEKYEAGGFDGMLLAWDADIETIAANLGKWRPNAATPTGVYTPSLKGRFSCAWVPDDVTDAGSSAPDTGRGLTGSWVTGWEDGYIPTIQTTGALYLRSFSAAQRQGTTISTATQPFQVLFDASRVWGEEHTGQAFAPAHIQQPYAIYLGVPA